jgi:hypothetical protein
VHIGREDANANCYEYKNISRKLLPQSCKYKDDIANKLNNDIIIYESVGLTDI